MRELLAVKVSWFINQSTMEASKLAFQDPAHVSIQISIVLGY